MSVIKGENRRGGKRPGAGMKPVGSSSRTATIMIRATPEWKEAVAALAKHDGSPSVNDLIDRAVAAYARERGYPSPIPRR